MTEDGHRLTGIGAALLGAALAHAAGGYAVPAILLALPGATAPDWLEWPRRTAGGSRTSVIPHRTLTHWVPLWLIAAGFGWAMAENPVASGLLGFAVGGLTHLAVDLPNPMGIPLWTPWRRVSLRLWVSGSHEIEQVLASWVIGFFAMVVAYRLN